MKSPLVSIIIPTYNEEKNLSRLFSSINKLNYPKNSFEVIVVDGDSSDQTVTIAKKYKAKVLFNKRRIRGAGCQIGVENAKGSIIAFTDADCVVPKNWLKGLLKYLKGRMIASVGGPNITPKDDTSFAKAVGKTMLFLTIAGARYGYHGKMVTETFHNPGCNVIYRKEAIKKVGGVNPSLVTCEDEELDFRIREKGYKILFTPSVIVDHYRRPTYKRIFIQAYRFAFGRAQAIRLHPKMARWFHFVPTLLFFSVAAAIFLSLTAAFYYLSYVLLVSLVFLSSALYLSLKSKYAPFYVYLLVLLLWFLGWGIGFLKGTLAKLPILQRPYPAKRKTKG